MIPRRRWDIATGGQDVVETLCSSLGLDPMISRLLVNRGVRSPEAAEEFLNPQLSSLADPFILPSMKEAANRIALARERNEKVCVFGDFDVDGLTGSAALLLFLRELGMDVMARTGERDSGHRGLGPEEVEELAGKGINLLVTVDTGISAHDAARRARELGIELIITDHHQPSGEGPEAVAVVNPQLSGVEGPLSGLVGAGVAFKLMMAVRKILRDNGGLESQPNLKRYMSFIAIGTVADCGPLVGENRIIVRHGLDTLASGIAQFPGLEALISVCGLGKGRPVNASSISFELAPRLNSVSRLEKANTALDLLVSQDRAHAESLASMMNGYNAERKAIQADILTEARMMLSKWPEDEKRDALALAGEGWNPGVIGIAASNLVDEFHVPVAVVSFGPDGAGKGSLRSVPGFDVHKALEEMEPGVLKRFGGHKGAAGLYISKDNFDRFKTLFSRAVAAWKPEGYRPPGLKVDMVLAPSMVSMETARKLEALEPLGEGAPPPLFLAESVELAGPPSMMGAKGQVARLKLARSGQMANAVSFRHAGFFRKLKWETARLDLVYSPEINTWNNVDRLQCRIVDVKKSGEV